MKTPPVTDTIADSLRPDDYLAYRSKIYSRRRKSKGHQMRPIPATQEVFDGLEPGEYAADLETLAVGMRYRFTIGGKVFTKKEPISNRYIVVAIPPPPEPRITIPISLLRELVASSNISDNAITTRDKLIKKLDAISLAETSQ